MGKGGVCGLGNGKDSGKEEKVPDMHKKFSDEGDSTRKRTDVFCCVLFVLFLGAMMGVFFMNASTADYDSLFNGMNHEGCTCGKTYNLCENVNGCDIVDESGSTDWSYETWEKAEKSPFEKTNAISIDWKRLGNKSQKKVAYGEVKKVAMKRRIMSYTIEIPSMKKKCDPGKGVNATTCKDCTQQEEDACYVDATWLQCKEESEGNFALPEMATLSLGNPEQPASLSVQCVAECPGAASEAQPSSNTTESDDAPVNLIVYDAIKYKDKCEGDKKNMCGGTAVFKDFTEAQSAELRYATPKGTPVGVYCAPDPNASPAIIQDAYKQIKSSGGASVVGSIYQGSSAIMLAMFLAVVVGFLWLKLMQMCVGFLAWGAIIGILLSFAGSWANMMAKADAACDQPKYFPNCDLVNDSDCSEAPDDCNPNVNYATTKYGAYCAAAVGMGCLLFIACMFKRIKLAVGCMEEASRCIQDQPSMNFFPIFQFIMTLVFMFFWMAGSVNIAASGDIEPKTIQVGPTPGQRIAISGVAKTITFTQSQFYQAWFWLFGYFWVTQFIAALGEMVLAGAAAAWYFRELPDRPPVKKPLMSAFKRAVKYHIGSVAFGSLIIAIIKFIRAVVAYIQAKANRAANKAGAVGKIVKVVLCLIQSCIWCLEKCMKFINRNAYILIAIHGISFCTAAKRAFFLILRNIARIGAVAVLSTIFLFLGKMFICGLPTAVAMYILVMNEETAVEAPMLPLFITAGICYLIGTSMMAVYGMTIDTMLICFVGDEEMHDNNPVYADGGLSQFVNKKSEEAKAAGVKSDMDDNKE